MSLRQELERRSRDTRFVIALLGGLLFSLTVVYYVILRGRDLPAALLTNQVMLFFLRNVNVLLILVILFVLARNLVKLWLERRRRTLGAKFKTKLIATYVGLSLVPVLLMFFFASELLRGSVERWFSPTVRRVLEQGNGVAQAMNRQIEERNLRAAARAARDLEAVDLRDPAARGRLATLVQEMSTDLGLDFLGVYAESEFVHAVVSTQSGIPDLPEPGRSFLREVVDKGQARRVLVPPGNYGRLLLSGTVGQLVPGRPRTVVVAGTLLDPAIAAQSEQLIQAFQTYRQLEVQKSQFKASYLLMFVTVTLLILLASSWMGLFLARQVMVPIQALAEGTKRVSTGDFEQTVEVVADDEIAVLVADFNRMTQDLRSNRELVEESHREQVATYRRLAEERALVAAVLDNVAAGVVSIARDGHIFTCNQAALSMLKQRQEVVVGSAIATAWSDPEHAKLARLVDGSGEGRVTAELRMVLAGEWKTFEVKITPLRDASGQAAGKVVVLEDLTELIKAQKLAAWTEAARRLAHEIKNPLTPIRLAAERLVAKYDPADASFRDTLEASSAIIVREVDTMQSLVDEFSRYARMPGPQPEAIDFAALAAEVLQLYRDLKPGLELGTAIDPALPPLWADREQLRRVLINLLDNAFEASEPPGRVTIGARPLEAGIEITVADSGRGIPEDSREKLFLPFFSTKGRGTGLGLAIVHRIVADHHGTIRIEDNAPRGTVFAIELPNQ